MAKYSGALGGFNKKKSGGGGVPGSTIVLLVVLLGLGGVAFFMHKRGVLKIDVMRARRINALRARARQMRYYY